jgi:RimJ/RimL family protein N-acetyltransferase
MADEPPDRIEANGSVLRRETADDAEAVARAIHSNLQRLAHWMEWATADTATADAQATRIAATATKWAAGQAFDYVIVDADDAILGKIGLPRRIGTDALELGYWIAAEAEGRGVITDATRALTDAALALDGIERVEIHCDEANTRSSAVPRRLGYQLDRVEDEQPITAPGETGRKMVWIYPRTRDN